MKISELVKTLEEKGMLKIALALLATFIGAGSLGSYVLIREATKSNSVYEGGGVPNILSNMFRSEFGDIENKIFVISQNESTKAKNEQIGTRNSFLKKNSP